MTNTQIVQTAFEVIVVVLMIVGLAYEPIIAKWEEKQKAKVMKAWKQRKKYRCEKKNV